jgi:hypothetical protein
MNTLRCWLGGFSGPLHQRHHIRQITLSDDLKLRYAFRDFLAAERVTNPSAPLLERGESDLDFSGSRLFQPLEGSDF